MIPPKKLTCTCQHHLDPFLKGCMFFASPKNTKVWKQKQRHTKGVNISDNTLTKTLSIIQWVNNLGSTLHKIGWICSKCYCWRNGWVNSHSWFCSLTKESRGSCVKLLIYMVDFEWVLDKPVISLSDYGIGKQFFIRGCRWKTRSIEGECCRVSFSSLGRLE